jgi:phosphatidylserine synthase
VGLPIPPAGGLIAALVHFAPAPLSAYGQTAAQFYGYALMALVVVLSILMVSMIRYSSMKTAQGRGRRGFLLVLIIAAIGMSIWFYSRYALIAIAAVYVSHGIIWWFARAINSKLRPSRST